jgi:hypothetical protein
MRLIRDNESFQKPLERAIGEAVDAVFEAGNPVHGAEQRVRIALDDKQDLERFIARTAELLNNRGFRDLPRLRHGWRAVPNCHHLTVGPWRGVFLVDPKSDAVVGLIFSKHPHRLDLRLEELVAAHQPKPDRPVP